MSLRFGLPRQRSAQIKSGRTRADPHSGSNQGENIYVGEVMKALPKAQQQKIFGKVEGELKALLPSDKRDRRTYRIVGGLDHEDGQLVVTAINPRATGGGARGRGDRGAGHLWRCAIHQPPDPGRRRHPDRVP